MQVKNNLILLLVLLFFAGCTENLVNYNDELVYDTAYEDEAAHDNTVYASTPLMWHVTSPDGQTMYLFGSIHAATKDLYPLPKYVMDAFHSSDYLAVEFNTLSPDADAMISTIINIHGIYHDGRTIADDLGIELYLKASTFLAKHDLAGFEMFRPFIWNDLLSGVIVEEAGLSFEHGLDIFFINGAEHLGMEILEIESALSQMRMLADMSTPLQVALIAETLENIDLAVQELKELYYQWKQGDMQALQEMLFHQGLIYEDELFAEYWDAMMTQRDIHMAEMARSYMAEGKNVFFVVGLAHFLTEDGGIIDLLEQNGYDVVRVQ